MMMCFLIVVLLSRKVIETEQASDTVHCYRCITKYRAEFIVLHYCHHLIKSTGIAAVCLQYPTRAKSLWGRTDMVKQKNPLIAWFNLAVLIEAGWWRSASRRLLVIAVACLFKPESVVTSWVSVSPALDGNGLKCWGVVTMYGSRFCKGEDIDWVWGSLFGKRAEK